MREKNIFDKIYNKELNLDFNNLKKLDEDSISKEKNRILNESVDLKSASNESLDAFITLLYNSKEINEVKIPSEFEKKVLKEKVLRNRVKAEKIREQIYNIKNRIKEKAKDNSYIHDISKSSALKKAANDVFGGNKTKITYEDYVYLLELKDEIIINESIDILEN